MERFSIECHKNPKQNNSNNQSEQRNILLRTKTIKLPKARENAADQVVIAFRVHLIGRESGASFLDQSQTGIKQIQSIPGLLSILN